MNTQAAALARFVNRLADDHEPGTIELVINGDFVDFLAERRGHGAPWRAALDPRDPDDLRCAGDLFARDAAVFGALGHLARRHRLTLMLGNHDVEISYPSIRRMLERSMGVDLGRDVQLIDDNRAYVVGDVLIEHGNRYDGFNAVAHDELRQLRSLLSRGEDDRRVRAAPPPGSRLVAEVMNAIKEHYPFVDLLKPETSAVIPLLLTFEPEYRSLAIPIARFKAASWRRDPRRDGIPRQLTAISSGASAAADVSLEVPDAAVVDEIERANARDLDGLAEVERELYGDGDLAPISSAKRITAALGFIQLCASRDPDLRSRLKALRRALAVLEDDQTFSLCHETEGAYKVAAERLARGPVKHVIFGHTHLARSIPLASGGVYINTGTWADLAELPHAELRTMNDDDLQRAIGEFLGALRTIGTHDWIRWRPYHARFEVDADGATSTPALLDARPYIPPPPPTGE